MVAQPPTADDVPLHRALGLTDDEADVIAALLGRWFWWPQRVRPRPASMLLRPTGPRALVRALLLSQRE